MSETNYNDESSNQVQDGDYLDQNVQLVLFGSYFVLLLLLTIYICIKLSKLNKKIEKIKTSENNIEGTHFITLQEKYVESSMQKELTQLSDQSKELRQKINQLEFQSQSGNEQWKSEMAKLHFRNNTFEKKVDELEIKTENLSQNLGQVQQYYLQANQIQNKLSDEVQNFKQDQSNFLQNYNQSVSQIYQSINLQISQLRTSQDQSITQYLNTFLQKIDQKIQKELGDQKSFMNISKVSLEKRIEELEKKKQEEHSLMYKNIESLQSSLQSANKELKYTQENIVQYKNELTQIVNSQKQLDQQNENMEQQFNFESLKSSLNQFGRQIAQQIDSVIKELQQKVKEQNLKLLWETRLIPQDSERKELAYQTIQKLYEQSINKRHVEIAYRRFVRDIQSEQEFFKNYSIRSSEMKEKLRGFCNKFRQVRGDGNCFYTSFGYQFLLILLNKYDDQQFGEFIKRMKDLNLPMKINLQDIKIDDQNIEQKLLYEFLFRLEDLRMIPDLKDREEAFTIQYGSYEKEGEIDGIFYGLSTIFFRNLANLAVESSESLAALYDRPNLLIWETECNTNEIVIEALSTYLKIHITLILFDNGGFQERFYGKELNDRIILLIKPGHYNVGIKQLENVEMPKDQQNLEIQKQEDTSAQAIYIVQTIQGLIKKFQPLCEGFVDQISNGQQNQY